MADQVETVDLSVDDPVEDAAEVSLATEPYDPRPQEDDARRTIAYVLLALLAVTILAAFIAVLVLPDRIDVIVTLLQIVFTPLVTLVSAATGFYYGTKK